MKNDNVDDELEKTVSKFVKYAMLGSIVSILLGLLSTGIVLWVLWHFISKIW